MTRPGWLDVVIAAIAAAFLAGIVVGRATAASRTGVQTALTGPVASVGALDAPGLRSEAPSPWTGTDGASTQPSRPVASAASSASPGPSASAASPGTRFIDGVASWYCDCTAGYPTGLYAAAGPALRTSGWRGRLVEVSYRGRSITVRLVDYCGCPGGRVIDLYATAFARLAPLSRGLIRVEVSVGR